MNWSGKLKEAFYALPAKVKNPFSNHEADGDTPDDTHICKALRKHYSDHGRNFPAWLPPDPNAPRPAVVKASLTPVGISYGGLSNQSSPWDTQPSPQQAVQQQSLRTRPVRTQAGVRSNPYQTQTTPEPEVQKRGLPSQQPGSHQNRGTAQATYVSRQDRLKMGLGKGGVTSPPMTSNTASPFQNQSRGNSYGSSNNAGSSYESSLEQKDDLYRGSGRRAADQPVMGANSPWANNDNEFGGGGYNPAYDTRSQGGGYGGQQGLPSNPSSGRRAAGLPNGPKRGYT